MRSSCLESLQPILIEGAELYVHITKFSRTLSILFASRQYLSKVKIQVGENVYVDGKSSVFTKGETLLTFASFPRHAADRD